MTQLWYVYQTTERWCTTSVCHRKQCLKHPSSLLENIHSRQMRSIHFNCQKTCWMDSSTHCHEKWAVRWHCSDTFDVKIMLAFNQDYFHGGDRRTVRVHAYIQGKIIYPLNFICYMLKNDVTTHLSPEVTVRVTTA